MNLMGIYVKIFEEVIYKHNWKQKFLFLYLNDSKVKVVTQGSCKKFSMKSYFSIFKVTKLKL